MRNAVAETVGFGRPVTAAAAAGIKAIPYACTRSKADMMDMQFTIPFGSDIALNAAAGALSDALKAAIAQPFAGVTSEGAVAGDDRVVINIPPASAIGGGERLSTRWVGEIAACVHVFNNKDVKVDVFSHNL